MGRGLFFNFPVDRPRATFVGLKSVVHSFFYLTSFLYTGLLGFEFSKNFDKKPSYLSGGLVFWGICLFKSLIADISP